MMELGPTSLDFEDNNTCILLQNLVESKIQLGYYGVYGKKHPIPGVTNTQGAK
jgi:hypothetical protein